MTVSQPGTQRRYARKVVMGIIAMQTVVGILIAIGLFFIKGWGEAYSALTGALIAVLPSYYLGNRIFGVNDATSGDVLLRQIYVAEMIKLAFTVALFLITILMLDAKFSIVMGTYATIVAVNWLAMKFSDLGEKPTSIKA